MSQEQQENPQETPLASPFDAMRHEDEEFGEHWSARELHKILGYKEWRNFHNTVIKRAMKACEENGRAVLDHFVQSYKMVTLGSGGQRKTDDVILSRYAAYLVVMNGDPKMPIVAMGQEYFAEQTRRQELAGAPDLLTGLPEDQLRLIRRSQMSVYNTQLAGTACNAGVIHPLDFAIFQDHGYRGLYGGLGAKAIHQRKGLKKDRRSWIIWAVMNWPQTFFVPARQSRNWNVIRLRTKTKLIVLIMRSGVKCAIQSNG